MELWFTDRFVDALFTTDVADSSSFLGASSHFFNACFNQKHSLSVRFCRWKPIPVERPRPCAVISRWCNASKRWTLVRSGCVTFFSTIRIMATWRRCSNRWAIHSQPSDYANSQPMMVLTDTAVFPIM